MLVRKDLVEKSHLTIENQRLFGATQVQLTFINDLLYRCPMEIHNMVLDNLYTEGADNVRFKITITEATKLINNLINGDEFKFIEYNTPEWHEMKIEEKKLKLINDYIDYDTFNLP